MTRLGMSGGEIGHILDSGIASAPLQGTLVTSPVRSGNYAFSFSTAKGSANYAQMAINADTIGVWSYSRAWIRIPAYPTSAVQIAIAATSGGSVAVFNLNPNGTITRTSGIAPFNSTSPLLLDVWYCLEIGIQTLAASTRVKARLNGVQWDDSVLNTGGVALLLNSIRLGIVTLPTGSFTIYVDDMAWNNDVGSVSNSWPGVAGKIVVMAANADVGTPIDWKLGAGGIWVNAWDSVNNIPPQGITPADNTKEVRNALATSNEDVDFRLPPYSTIKSVTDVVSAVQTYVSFNRSGSLTPFEAVSGLVANPVGTMVQTGSVGTGLSNWPGSWANTRTPVVSYPNVLGSDRPVIRIGRRSAVTGTLYCCFVGLMVEYEPLSTQQFIGVP